MREMVLASAWGECAVVLDADALTSFSNDPSELGSAIKTRGAATLLTPHEGEFSRLFNCKAEALFEGKSKLDRARRAAELTGAVFPP